MLALSPHTNWKGSSQLELGRQVVLVHACACVCVCVCARMCGYFHRFMFVRMVSCVCARAHTSVLARAHTHTNGQR